jgi:hypothetical protein
MLLHNYLHFNLMSNQTRLTISNSLPNFIENIKRVIDRHNYTFPSYFSSGGSGIKPHRMLGNCSTTEQPPIPFKIRSHSVAKVALDYLPLPYPSKLYDYSLCTTTLSSTLLLNRLFPCCLRGLLL